MEKRKAIEVWSNHFLNRRKIPNIDLKEKDGVTFYPVGLNSSHIFYVGIDTDNQLYRMTVGDEYNDKLDEYEALVEKITKIDSIDLQYWGHD
jgi:hypothetical protein